MKLFYYTLKKFDNIGKKATYAFLFLHLLASQIFLPYIDKAEIFPIYNWRLFHSCHPYSTIPEMEISFEDKEDIITNKEFSTKLQSKSRFIIKRLFKTKNQEKIDELLNQLLHLVSYSINEKAFNYKIFKSRIRLVEYVQQDSLKKQALFKQGNFQR